MLAVISARWVFFWERGPMIGEPLGYFFSVAPPRAFTFDFLWMGGTFFDQKSFHFCSLGWEFVSEVILLRRVFRQEKRT